MYRIDSKQEKPDIGYMKDEITRMMQRGIAVGDINSLYTRFENERKEIAKDIQDKYGIQNPNSSQQIVRFIEGLESPEVYEACYIDGKWTTNKDALATLSLLGHQFATDILDYRKAKKYAESIKSMIDAVGTDGRVHPQVSLSKTNRINYSSPALMNIPKPLLWHIIKPNKPGNVLISADIKNQEPSILINILNIESLKEALTDPNGLYEHLFSRPFQTKAKLHIFVTADFKQGLIPNSELAKLDYMPPVYYTPSIPAVSSTYYNGKQVRFIDATNIVKAPNTGKPDIPNKVLIQTIDGSQYMVDVVWDKYDERKLSKNVIIDVEGVVQGFEVRCEGINRKEFKTSWNAMTYGAGALGIKQMCKHINGEAIYNYFSKIEEFKKYRTMCRKAADNGQQNIRTYFGTILTAGESNTGRLKRILMDLPVQGTAADILSMLIRHANQEIKARGLEGKLSIYYTRHDEIIFEADKDWVESVGMSGAEAEIRDIVEHQVDDWTPFKLEVNEVTPDTLYIDETDDIFE